MEIYLYKKDMQTKVKVIKYDEAGTYMVRFLNGKNKGTIKTYSSGTIKRWWSKIEEATPEDKVDSSVEEKTKTKRTMPKHLLEREKIKNRMTSYNSLYVNNVNCYKVFKTGQEKKTILEIYPRTKHIEVRVKNVLPNVHCVYKDGYKYYLPVHYFITYEHIDYLDIMESIINGCL